MWAWARPSPHDESARGEVFPPIAQRETGVAGGERDTTRLAQSAADRVEHGERLRLSVDDPAQFHQALLVGDGSDRLEDGTLRPGYVANVLYHDFMTDPVDTIRRLSADLRIPFRDESAEQVRRYLAAKPQGTHGKYEYDRAQGEQIAVERERFRAYQEFFRVPNEI